MRMQGMCNYDQFELFGNGSVDLYIHRKRIFSLLLYYLYYYDHYYYSYILPILILYFCFSLIDQKFYIKTNILKTITDDNI